MAQRDHRATFARRNERARREGFRSYAEKRRFGGSAASRVRNQAHYDRLPRAARQERRRVLRAISEIRKGRAAEGAARRNETTIDAIKFWGGGSVLRGGDIRASDRLWRPMEAIDAATHSRVPVGVRGSEVASRLSAYWHAVQTYVYTGQDADLQTFQGVRIAGVELETNLDVIDHLARLGQLRFEDIYRGVAA